MSPASIPPRPRHYGAENKIKRSKSEKADGVARTMLPSAAGSRKGGAIQNQVQYRETETREGLEMQ